jgi:formamidopyrimidine-DNA glycosylase
MIRSVRTGLAGHAQEGFDPMPELPEVETTRRGIAPRLEGVRVSQVVIRERRLRWPISSDLETALTGAVIDDVTRRGKYILLRTGAGAAILHLGMSGCVRIVAGDTAVKKHDHFDLRLESGDILRFNDPRRFGCLLWAPGDAMAHPLLAKLGPEPLTRDFNGHYLAESGQGRRVAIKPHLMNSRIVVGVGNIYASEALFRSGIHPKRSAGRISRERMGRLVDAVKAVLDEAIRFGGTTLRDFYDEAGRPGYFRNELRVYGREGEPCLNCRTPLRHIVLGQRATFYCGRCQR